MADSLRKQTWRFIRAAFPERQIYIRSDGRVQFFTFGPLMQAIFAGITFAFLGWVAFTSVNVVFKDRIIATKETRFQEMQASYETRVTDLQLAYDELNGALINAEDRFTAKANELDAKHRTLATLIRRKQNLQALVGNAALSPTPGGPATAATSAPSQFSQPQHTSPAADSLSVGGEYGAVIEPPGKAAPAILPPRAGSQGAVGATGAELPMLPQTQAVDPRTARPQRSSMLEGAVEKLAGALFGRNRLAAAVPFDHPVLRRIATEQARLNRVEGVGRALTAETEGTVTKEIAHLQRAIHVAGIDPRAFVQQIAGPTGSKRAAGGPLIPLPGPAVNGIRDAGFNNQISRIGGELDELSNIVRAMRSIPLTVPMQDTALDISSGFGARIDPFTKRLAFHAGLDFTGPWGSTIHATAPGVVVHAGPRGPYGNAVEIDHGLGVRTRYGHLSAILVRPGAKVEKGAPVGRLGSSGRSTGPHVHYEVWYDEAARDPSKFIEAGRYVLKEQN